jgi:hypothetical protein
LKLQAVCEACGLKMKTMSVTSYVQYDSGRQQDPMSAEIRPSAIFVFEKK